MHTAALCKQARAVKLSSARAIRDKVKAENREMTPDEAGQLQALMTAVNDLSNRVATLEALESEEGTADAAAAADEAARSGRRSGAMELPNLDAPRQKYSLVRAIRSFCENNGRLDGLEGETSQAIATQLGRSVRQGVGFFVPWNLATHRSPVGVGRGGEYRTAGLVDTTAATGSIANILGTELIDILRNKMTMQAAGARVLSGLIGATFSLPKQTQADAAYWVAEATAPTTSNAVFGQVTWTPKTVGTYTDLTRKTLLQTSIDIEAIIRSDLAKVVALELDRVGSSGTGVGAQPTGITNNSSITTVAMGANGLAPTWGNLVALEETVATANADAGALAYLTNPKVRSKLKRTWIADDVGTVNTAGKTLWNRDDRERPVNDYPCFVTNQIPRTLTKGTSAGVCSANIFGNFESAIYGLWGALEIIIDPYTLSSTGGVRLVILQDADFQVRYNESFVKCLDYLTV